jgi:hypothetical protein
VPEAVRQGPSTRAVHPARVVTRMITDGRTDGRTMAAGASVTWTHCSVLFEVTWGKTLASTRTHPSVCADAKTCPRGRTLVSARTWASKRTWASARTHLPPLPSPSLPFAVRADVKKNLFFIYLFIYFLSIFFGSC